MNVHVKRKGDALYAIVLAWPASGRVTIRSLNNTAPPASGGIAAITLLGSGATVDWTQDDDGLTLTMPDGADPDEPAYAFRIDVNGTLMMKP